MQLDFDLQELGEAQEKNHKLREARDKAKEAFTMEEARQGEIIRVELEQDNSRVSEAQVGRKLLLKRDEEPLLSLYSSYVAARSAYEKHNIKVQNMKEQCYRSGR